MPQLCYPRGKYTYTSYPSALASSTRDIWGGIVFQASHCHARHGDPVGETDFSTHAAVLSRFWLSLNLACFHLDQAWFVAPKHCYPVLKSIQRWHWEDLGKQIGCYMYPFYGADFLMNKACIYTPRKGYRNYLVLDLKSRIIPMI